MVYLTIREEEGTVIVDGHKLTKDGEYFRLVVDKATKEVLERPEKPDIDASAAYSRVCSLMDSGKPLPQETVAEWG